MRMNEKSSLLISFVHHNKTIKKMVHLKEFDKKKKDKIITILLYSF